MFREKETVDPSEWTITDSGHKLSMRAAQRLAVLCGETGQRGFEVFSRCGGRLLEKPFRPEDIEIEVLARLCLVANTDRVPTDWRSAAASAGGILPRPDLGLRPEPPWHSCAWAGNENLALCKKLLAKDPRPELPHSCGGGYDRLLIMEKKNAGDVVECALAAADCASAAEQHLGQPRRYPYWARDYRDVVGDGSGSGDIVTKWIQDELHTLIAGPRAPGGMWRRW